MRYVVLLSHGYMASGLKSTVELITGEQKRLSAYDAYVDGHNDVKKYFEDFVAEHADDEIIAVTDVLGGSVNNEILAFNHMPNIYVISGMNAPLVINLVVSTETNTIQMIRESIGECKELIQFFETKEEKYEEEDF